MKRFPSRFVNRHPALLLLVVACIASPRWTEAQSASQPALTLGEAQELAARNNPDLQQTLNAERSATAALRTARGAFLPSISASFGTSLQQGGRQVLSGAELGASSDVIQSSYSIGISWRLSAATILNPRIQRANREAVEADIVGAVASLRSTVTQQYLTVLQSEARARLQDTLIISAQLQLDLAKARAATGAAIQLDVQRAEVALGQVQVAQIQALNQTEIDKLRLFQTMGIALPTDTRLSTVFDLAEPGTSLEALLDMARQENPALLALQSRDRVNELGVKRARSEYLPSLGLGTGFGGYTYQYRDPDFLVQRGRSGAENQRESCFSTDSLRLGAGMPGIAAQCELITFGQADEARLRAENRQFPFDFTRNPGSISASISVPIFDGFGREQRVQEAQVARDNSRHALRARELAVTTEVTAAWLTLNASLRAARLQEQNAAKARLELQLVLERYRVGSATFVEVADSRSLYETAENDRINAVYDYHKAFAALESAVGRPIR
jgi:outer membrane protein